MRDIKTPEMALGDLNRVTTTMFAHQWESIAALLQNRLFAICDIATNMVPPVGAEADEGSDGRDIMDLCRLTHTELAKKGLLR